MLFSDSVSIINLSRYARIKRENVNSACQTLPFSMADKEAQSISLINEQVHSLINIQTQTITSQNIIKSTIENVPALLQFLIKVEPLVSRTLMENLKSSAFCGMSHK